MAEVIEALDSNLEGISSASAGERLTRFGRNSVDSGQNRRRALRMFIDRFRSPLVLILVFAAFVALVVHDWLDAAIILAIVLASAVLGHVQEYRAMNAVRALRQRVSIKALVKRDGCEVSIPAEEVVPGDVVLLSAGSLIPADGLILTAKDFYVSQATLTGETFPVDKQPGIVPPEAVLAERSNCVFMGTSVRSGTANALIVTTGRTTHFGAIAETLARRPVAGDVYRPFSRLHWHAVPANLRVWASLSSA